MLVLLDMTRGVVPLIGPHTSIPGFHHGALYYYLLSPAAFLSSGNPEVILAWNAVLGLLVVLATWWLAHVMGGTAAGLLAGVLAALSPAAIEASTFIWNSNLVPLFAAVSLAALWRGSETGRGVWWAVGIAAAGAVAQLNVVGTVYFAAALAIYATHMFRMLRTTPTLGSGARPVRQAVVGGLAGVLLLLILFLPLLVHEAQTGLSETQALLGSTGRSPTDAEFEPAPRMAVILLRLVSWPVVDVLTDALVLAAIVTAVWFGLVVWQVSTASGQQRRAQVWCVALILGCGIALTVLVPALERVTVGFPNDHWHAFANPIVLTSIALGAVHLLERGPASKPARAIAVALVALLLAGELSRLPQQDVQGGWRAADSVGQKIVSVAGGRPIVLVGLPDPAFSSIDAVRFPVVFAGAQLTDRGADSAVVMICDRVLESLLVASCGGLAEDRLLATTVATGQFASAYAVERFEAPRKRAVSVYIPLPTIAP